VRFFDEEAASLGFVLYFAYCHCLRDSMRLTKVQNHSKIREKNVTFIGGFAPHPHHRLCPWTPLGSTAAPRPLPICSRPCHPPPPEIPGSAPDGRYSNICMFYFNYCQRLHNGSLIRLEMRPNSPWIITYYLGTRAS
jgi:hypothetical protein